MYSPTNRWQRQMDRQALRDLMQDKKTRDAVAAGVNCHKSCGSRVHCRNQKKKKNNAHDNGAVVRPQTSSKNANKLRKDQTRLSDARTLTLNR